MQRYFAQINNNKVLLTNDDQHHLLHVMRAKVGEEIEVVDQGKAFLCKIDSLFPLSISSIEEIAFNSELNKEITLFFALAKGDKIETVIQKSTELGVSRIVLFTCKRCVTDFSNKDTSRKFERYNKIAKEASEQSHRLKVPEIVGVIDINKIPNDLLCDENFVAYEKEAGNTTNSFNLNCNSKTISIMVGPEGGFEESEILRLEGIGFKSISLGKRILRCETATFYSLSVLSYLLEK